MTDLNYQALAGEISEKLQAMEVIVLSTCSEGRVTARTMCPINDGLTVLFSTDRRSLKVAQMRENPRIALTAGNLTMEAVAELFGHPQGHPTFLRDYAKKYPELGALYESGPDDFLVIARPVRVSLFKYIDGPCEDVLIAEEERAYRS